MRRHSRLLVLSIALVACDAHEGGACAPTEGPEPPLGYRACTPSACPPGEPCCSDPIPLYCAPPSGCSNDAATYQFLPDSFGPVLACACDGTDQRVTTRVPPFRWAHWGACDCRDVLYFPSSGDWELAGRGALAWLFEPCTQCEVSAAPNDLGQCVGEGGAPRAPECCACIVEATSGVCRGTLFHQELHDRCCDELTIAMTVGRTTGPDLQPLEGVRVSCTTRLRRLEPSTSPDLVYTLSSPPFVCSTDSEDSVPRRAAEDLQTSLRSGRLEIALMPTSSGVHLVAAHVTGGGTDQFDLGGTCTRPGDPRLDTFECTPTLTLAAHQAGATGEQTQAIGTFRVSVVP
jgi:hypothetical protein